MAAVVGTELWKAYFQSCHRPSREGLVVGLLVKLSPRILFYVMRVPSPLLPEVMEKVTASRYRPAWVVMTGYWQTKTIDPCLVVH